MSVTQMPFSNQNILTGFQIIFSIQNLDYIVRYFDFSQIMRESEIRSFEIRKHLKSGLSEGRIKNGPVFKWLGLSYCYSPNHLKTGPIKIRSFCPNFKCFLTK